MEIPELLKDWVATGDQEPAPIIGPCYIDYRATKDLLIYHPGYTGSIVLSVKLLATKDSSGNYNPYATVKGFDAADWSDEMYKVLGELKLYPDTSPAGDRCLLDKNIKNINTPLMHGWKVVEWMIVKSFGVMNHERINQEIITWKKDDLEIKSAYSWRPYKVNTEHQASKGLIPNERPVNFHVHLGT